MLYPQYFIDDLKNRADIVRIVETHVQLKKKGANFWGNCPFHGEKTASFSVSPAKGFYKCFGCGKSGNAYTFLMEQEGLNFPEAIKKVAEMSGMPLPEPVDDEQYQRTKKKKAVEKKIADEVIELNSWALEFWENEFNQANGEAEKAREYLANRGITEETQKTFRIGYAPDTWDALLKVLKEKGADEKLITLSGLVSVNEEKKRIYDRFRGRIIFPVLDINGRPIAFGARILDKGEPKYLNSPETPAYIKGEHLYGLFQNKADIQQKKFAILVEGYLDLIALYQFGVKNAVASLGTALTNEQAKLLSRFARKVVVNYDGDSAGVKAARRAIEPLLAQDFEIKILTLPNGQDPDDFIRANGLESYNKQRGNADPHLQFVLENAVRERNLALAKQKAEAIEDVLPVISAVRNPITKRESFDQAMTFLRVEDAILKQDLWKTIKLGTHTDIKQAVARRTQPKLTIAEQRLLELLITDAELREIILPQLEQTDFEALATASIFQALIELQQTGEKPTADNLTKLVAEDAIAEDILPILLMSDSGRDEGEAIDDILLTAEKCVIALRLMALSTRIMEVSNQSILAQQEGNEALINHLSIEQIELEKLKRELERANFARYAQTPMGKSYLENLAPLSNRIQLENDLRAISETILLNEEKQATWNFSGLDDPADAIAILKIKNATLEPTVLLEVTRVCNQALFARSIISPEKDFVPNLWKIVENIPPSLFEAINKINKKLLPSGEIDDSASPELARLRRETNLQRGRLQKTLEGLMRANSDAIQDAIVTQRNERFVVPVKADFRGKISGVAHGFSSSGATMFIEPLEVIDTNNELAGLKAKEEAEIARILFSLTEDLRKELPNIENAVLAVAELDFVKAKVEFARRFKAIVPKISDDETLELIEARHPILEENLKEVSPQRHRDTEEENPKSKIQNPKSEIVANSFKLTKQNSVMIISGANAGGKTVVMKTAGLLSLMAISGLPVPAKDAVIPFYSSILADIGDHQSLSANLSTFSSHISNIAEMLDNSGTPALVLLDEVGTGTDPDEGSALGVAIVDTFRQKGAQVIASTHYKGLKIYATNDENVINASVEFDEKTLQPTYRLLTGFSGASSGIEIARRFGIPNQVIEKARLNLDQAAKETEQFLLKIRRESQTAEDLRTALEEEREVTANKYALLDIEAGKREKERQKEFEKTMSETMDSFDKQIKAFLQTIEDKALKAKFEKETLARKAELKRHIFTAETQRRGEKPAPSAALDEPNIVTETRPVILGDKVLTSLGNVGIVEKIDGNIAEVLVGSMRLREKLKQLKVVAATQSDTTKYKANPNAAKTLRLDDTSTQIELNLIGKRTDEAEYMLDKFLDESYMSSMQRVRIIHGFGTGALKNFVHHYLKNHDLVLRYTFAEQNQGGQGATIAELKQ